MPVKGSYLTFEGYHIPLSSLTKNQIKIMESDLTVSPIDYGYGAPDSSDTKYSIYNKNDDYIIIPRYYGIEHYGIPESTTLEEHKATIDFTGTLRDYQHEIVEKCSDHIIKHGGGLMAVPCGFGKCLAKGTLVKMLNNTSKKVEEINIGDTLLGDDLSCRNVLSLAYGTDDMYTIHQNDLPLYTVNKSHILSLKSKETNDVIDISVTEYLELDHETQQSFVGYRTNNIHEYDLTYDITVKYSGVAEYFGFEIDGNKRFVLNDYTVTHNTSMAIYLASKLGLKTLVLTHKSFLQNQWVDRIKQFTTSSIGIIRQNVVDVENRDIVIGMIQSISKRDYGENIFNKFGVVIIDECHRFGSKYFSNALYKVGAKYTIALTATPQRADGLMKVVNWFVGDIMYQKKVKVNNNVVVKSISYLSDSDLFKEVVRTRKINKGGKWVSESKPDFVQMISNIINLKKRNKTIIKILNSLRKNPDRKILILSERIAHLRELKDSLDECIQEDVDNGFILPNECKTYFYIGDLKRHQLEEAELEADILFGSFKMAEEGLDIERLNTVVLATPKKDVVQACGRILRKATDTRPLIIDISDKFSIFHSQSRMRDKYYNKCEYLQHFYYVNNSKLISPQKYLTLVEKSNDTASKKTPKSFDDILEIPDVEIEEIAEIVENDTDTNNQSNVELDDKPSKKKKNVEKKKIEKKNSSIGNPWK